MVRWLFGLGVTANQVTLAAALISIGVAFTVYLDGPDHQWVYLLLPIWMLLRMALNAIDGMLAREFGQQSKLGAYLNEISDVVADTALYLSLLSIPGISAPLLLLMAAIAALTEYAGVLGLMVGASRRYDGPMGKSDRAFVIGVLGLLLAGGWASDSTVDLIVGGMTVLAAVTVVRRVFAGLWEGRPAKH